MELDDAMRRLEAYRQYLYLLARLELDPRLQGKVDISGVVQVTLLEAHREVHKYRGTTSKEWASWLRRILANNLTDEVRKLSAQMRDVFRERSLEAEIEQSSARIEHWLAVEESSPSLRVSRQEDIFRLANALSALPANQRQAVELHHLREIPLAEVAVLMGRSRGAVASLIFRGIQQLRCLMGANDLEFNASFPTAPSSPGG